MVIKTNTMMNVIDIDNITVLKSIVQMNDPGYSILDVEQSHANSLMTVIVTATGHFFRETL